MNPIRIVLLVSLGLVLSVSIHAQNEPLRLPLDKLMSKDDQTATGVSKLSASERQALEVWLTNFALRAMQAAQNAPAQNAPAQKPGPAGPAAAVGPYAGVNVRHWIKSVVERGQTIQLEDGSIWQINPFNKVDAILWMVVERITVIDSGNALYPYKLINSDGRSSAEAKLISK